MIAELCCAHVAQLAEHFLGKGEVTGSSPVAGSKIDQCKAAGVKNSVIEKNRSVALMVERQTPNLMVGGSSPSWPAIKLLMHGL